MLTTEVEWAHAENGLNFAWNDVMKLLTNKSKVLEFDLFMGM
jgi:hypothetical protein